MTLRQQSRRRKNIAAASEQLTALGQRLLSARARLRGAAQIDLEVAEILGAPCGARRTRLQAGAGAHGPRPHTARSPGAATASSGTSMRRPSPMTRIPAAHQRPRSVAR
ncbi:MAG: hypothetical protein ACREXY_03990 [Gammaproteobacteria bacterium]